MKQWKTVLVSVVFALLVGALVVLALRVYEPQRDIKDRISQYQLVLEEQQLITDILTLRYDVAVIQAKFKPAPQTQTIIESKK